MSKVLFSIVLIGVLLAVIACGVSTTTTTSPSRTTSSVSVPAKAVDDSIVQVWYENPITRQPAFSGTGIVVGNGSQVLTVINYGGYTPDDSLQVVWPVHGKYTASIKVIDPRNSVTYLEISGAKIPSASISDEVIGPSGISVSIRGWKDFGQGPEFRTGDYTGPGIGLLGSSTNGTGDGFEAIGDDGNVVGIIGTLYNEFGYRLGPMGLTGTFISIKDALGLLDPNIGSQMWAEGPVEALIASRGARTGITTSEYPFRQVSSITYEEMTKDVQALLGTMGQPLAANEIPSNYRTISSGTPENTDGILLSLLYPRPVELYDSKGNQVANAKWIGIKWARSSGKLNQVFYGSIRQGDCVMEGGFILEGDVSSLAHDIGTP